jgi:hypothetical protein
MLRPNQLAKVASSVSWLVLHCTNISKNREVGLISNSLRSQHWRQHQQWQVQSNPSMVLRSTYVCLAE